MTRISATHTPYFSITYDSVLQLTLLPMPVLLSLEECSLRLCGRPNSDTQNRAQFPKLPRYWIEYTILESCCPLGCFVRDTSRGARSRLGILRVALTPLPQTASGSDQQQLATPLNFRGRSRLQGALINSVWGQPLILRLVGVLKITSK